MDEMRLQKAIALRGCYSRREAEKLILDGKVMVNDKLITTLGSKVNNNDNIKINGKLITNKEKKYYLLNKPSGYISTYYDKFKRKSIAELFNNDLKLEQLFPIDKLDYITSGALILTNDSNLAGIDFSKVLTTYEVRIFNIINQGIINKLLKGINVKNDIVKFLNISDIKLDKKNNQSSFKFDIYIKNDKMLIKIFNDLGLKIKWLKRLSIIDIKIDGLNNKEIRPLKIHEIKKLHVL